ncbi:unnamed protein product, partial [Didymodactylos carnosus]
MKVATLILFIVFLSRSQCETSSSRCKRQVSAGCILAKQETEGPYYWNTTVRQDIT